MNAAAVHTVLHRLVVKVFLRATWPHWPALSPFP